MKLLSTNFLQSVLLPILCVWGVALSGQEESKKLDGSLVGYLKQALRGNPHHITMEAEYEAAKSRIPQVTALPDPTFEITHFVESIQTRTGPQERIYSIKQQIPWFGKLKTAETKSTKEAQAVWYSLQNHQLILAKKVSVEFFEYGFTGKAIELTTEIRNLLTQLEPIVEQKVSVGGSLNSLLRLKVEIGKIDDRLLSLKQKRLQQSAEFNKLLGRADSPLVDLPIWDAPSAFIPEDKALVASILQNNPELKMLLLKIDSKREGEELARLAKFPDVTLGVNYVDLGNRVSGTFDNRENPWGVTLSVNIPIWREKIKAQHAEAQAITTATVHEYHDRFLDLTTELAVCLLAHEDAQRRLKLYGEELLDLAKQAVQNSRASYENGKATILEVIDSERSLLDMQLLYWRAASDVWRQRVTMQTLANQPIMGKFKATQEEQP